MYDTKFLPEVHYNDPGFTLVIREAKPWTTYQTFHEANYCQDVDLSNLIKLFWERLFRGFNSKVDNRGKTSFRF